MSKFKKVENEEPKKHAHVHCHENERNGQEYLERMCFPLKEERFFWKKGGTDDVRLFWICWTPPIGVKVGNVKIPICTHQDRKTFMEELERAYKLLWSVEENYQNSLKPKQTHFGFAVNE